MVRLAVEALPPNLREMIILRDFEGMAYREIAEVIEHPIGTVMSRLARARRHLQTHADSEFGGRRMSCDRGLHNCLIRTWTGEFVDALAQPRDRRVILRLALNAGQDSTPLT